MGAKQAASRTTGHNITFKNNVLIILAGDNISGPPTALACVENLASHSSEVTS